MVKFNKLDSAEHNPSVVSESLQFYYLKFLTFSND